MRWPVPRAGFDPKKQSWVEGAIGAAETVAGGLVALVAGIGTFATGSMILEGRATHAGRLSPVQGLSISLGLVSIGVAFLWAGLSLTLGCRTTWRTQAVPVATVLLAVIYASIVWARDF